MSFQSPPIEAITKTIKEGIAIELPDEIIRLTRSFDLDLRKQGFKQFLVSFGGVQDMSISWLMILIFN